MKTRRLFLAELAGEVHPPLAVVLDDVGLEPAGAAAVRQVVNTFGLVK